MNCDQVLPRLLAAEEHELAGEGTSVIAAHVRGCAKCGRVARTLLTDTRALAVAASAPRTLDFTPLYARTRPARRLVVTAGMASLAASIIAGVLIQYGLTTKIGLGPALTDGPVLRGPSELATERPGLISGQPTLPRPRGVAIPEDAKLVVVEPVNATPVREVSLARIDRDEDKVAVPTSSDNVVVNVDPPPGRRFRVMRPTTPGVTVVWVY